MGIASDMMHPTEAAKVDYQYDPYDPSYNEFFYKNRPENNAFAAALEKQAREGGLGISELRGQRGLESVGQQAAMQQAARSRGNEGIAAALAARAYGQGAGQTAFQAAQGRLQEAAQANQAYQGYMSAADKSMLARHAITNQQRIAQMEAMARKRAYEQDALNQRVGATMGALGAGSAALTKYGQAQNAAAASNAGSGAKQ